MRAGTAGWWRGMALWLMVVAGLASGRATAGATEASATRTISGQVTLPAEGRYRGTLLITDSGTVLDCQGAIFDGQGADKVGLIIDSRGKPLSGVTVRNCVFRNYAASGVLVTWGVADTAKGADRAAIYARTPRDVTLDRLTVSGSGQVGVYVDDYVSRLRLTDSVIEDTAGVGLYLEFGSRDNRILGNTFRRNGFRRLGLPDREALAVDSSAGNRIEGNRFEGNAAGAIFLYKNCGEHIHSGNQVPRWLHSDHNLIRDNLFKGERVGVWLASRQSRDLRAWDCADAPMDAAGRYFEDFADHNQVIGNTFCQVAAPIRNEGDFNVFRDNRFDPAVAATIEEPESMRARLLGRPTTGTVSTGNGPADCARASGRP